MVARVLFTNGKATERNYLGYVFFTLFFCSGFCSLLYEGCGCAWHLHISV
jgi:hypothetical protein